MNDLHYGSGDVYGFLSTDSVCIKPDKCASDFLFMTVVKADDLKGLATSGIVGLSPKIDDTTNDLFILKLKETGTIERAVFSLMIELTHDSSKMTFGGYDLQNMAALGTRLVYHNIDTSERNR